MKRKIYILLPAILLSALSASGQVRNDSISVLAFRSNLLIPLTNIGIEIPISNRISIEGDFYSPWIMREWIDKRHPSHQNCFQLVAGTIGGRFWLDGIRNHKESDPLRCLRGHSVGIIASGGIYDFEQEWKGQQGEFAFLGIDYLYGLPLGKGGAHLEFNIGIGYGFNRYHNYDVRYEGGRLISDGGGRIRHRAVPIRLALSLAIPIFRKHTNHIEVQEGRKSE